MDCRIVCAVFVLAVFDVSRCDGCVCVVVGGDLPASFLGRAPRCAGVVFVYVSPIGREPFSEVRLGMCVLLGVPTDLSSAGVSYPLSAFVSPCFLVVFVVVVGGVGSVVVNAFLPVWCVVPCGYGVCVYVFVLVLFFLVFAVWLHFVEVCKV